MAKLVDTFIDRMKVPEKLELSQADRQLLQKLAASVEELKTKKNITEQQLGEAEQRLLTQIRILLEESQKSAPAPEPAKPQEMAIDFSELRHFISEEVEQEKYQTKSLIEEKHGSVTAQLQSLISSVKDDEILSKLPSLFNQVSDTEMTLRKQIRTVKIMLGFSIWISIMTLAAMAAQALGLI